MDKSQARTGNARNIPATATSVSSSGTLLMLNRHSEVKTIAPAPVSVTGYRRRFEFMELRPGRVAIVDLAGSGVASRRQWTPL